MAQELTAQAREFLGGLQFAVLATINPNGTPQQTVMWYELRDNMIVMNTTTTRLKGQNLRRDPRISVCVADGYRFVTIAGTAQLNDDPAVTQADIRALAIRYHGPEQGARQAEEVFSKQNRVSIYLPVERALLYGFGD